MADNTVGTAYAVVVTAVADPRQVEGLEWDRAVEYLPSIDSRSMQRWVRAQESGPGARRGVVIPGSHRRVATRHPYREVCVPSAEYQLFSAAVRTNRRRALATTCAEDETRQRTPALSTAH
ncbi:hypothetical protein [Nocardia sp. CDC160]|uniref:hypothetical protein n=1 Tax=Nocardia sp. CDC160 TaxID=3112166 RepID=UPI002DB6ABEB|nr:hypothetical protein [Nocardia sp. CDC160]MEC3916152.1 hypothetical protein [Nocardia sp. CDC160]